MNISLNALKAQRDRLLLENNAMKAEKDIMVRLDRQYRTLLEIKKEWHLKAVAREGEMEKMKKRIVMAERQREEERQEKEMKLKMKTENEVTILKSN